MPHYVVLGRGWTRQVELPDGATHLDVLDPEPTADMAIGPLDDEAVRARVFEIIQAIVAGQASRELDGAAEELIREDQVHDLRRVKPGGSGASRLVKLGGTFGGGVGLAEWQQAMLAGRGGTLQGATVDVTAAEAAKLVPPGGNGPRNRAERRAKAKMDRKFKAAQQRLHHENRYTQAHEIMDTGGEREWDQLDREDQKDLLEQADQSRDRW